MSLNRRMILGSAGALILSTAKGRTFVQAATTSDPRSAWKSAGSHSDARVRALSYAILAPNPNLIRIGRSEVQAHPDGISLDAPVFDDLAKQADATRGALADPSSPAYKQMLGLSRGPVDATPAYLWLVTPSNTRQDQLDAGRDWVRINLASAGLGLGLHPQSATLQEYPEMDDLLREVHRVLGIGQGRVQMIGRVGYTSAAPPSPRWPVETRIRQP